MSSQKWPDKRAIVSIVIQQMRDELAQLTRIARDAAKAATHEENRAEGDKDMRATEASYLARGQAGRVHELEQSINVLSALDLKHFEPTTPIQASALVALARGPRRSIYFLLPTGGGRQVTVDGTTVSILTPTSPLGSAVLGLVVGDEAEISSPTDDIVYEVVGVN